MQAARSVSRADSLGPAGLLGRHGYAVDITAALLDFAFDQLGLEKIHGETGNMRASRLAAFFGGVEIASDSAPDWMAANGWRQTRWLITRQAYIESRRNGRSKP